jgi:hypothetical protein
MMADTMGPGLCQATQPLIFGIGFIVALALPLSNAQWLVGASYLPSVGMYVYVELRRCRGCVFLWCPLR